MTPKPLADRLLNEGAFDPVFIRDHWNGVATHDDYESARAENARLRPLLEAAAEVVSAADEANELSKEDATRYPQLEKALAKLNRLLGEVK